LSGLLIVGAGGHGAVVAEAAAESGRWERIEFLDDNLVGSKVLDFPVVGSIEEVARHVDDSNEFVVAVGDNTRRLDLLNTIRGQRASIGTVIHPAAHVSKSATLGEGCVVFAGVVVNARAVIGVGVILNTGATVDHDCVIGDGVHVSPGANIAGNVHVGDRTWIGIGSSVREGMRIGSDSIVGAGSAVVSDVADQVTVGGVPAKSLNEK